MSILPSEVAALIDRFVRNRDAYRNPAYNEAQTRREFIDPLFKALGWDLDNVGGRAEAYKDVVHEDSIKVGGDPKAPDYCFRIGGTRKFFVEAKKPAVAIETDPEPAHQLRRYAWTSKLPLSILTDFEEFAVYDCRIPPKVSDKASTARVFYCMYDQYAAHWDYISGLFSKDAVLTGAFDQYAESNKRKKGTAEVDTEFLKQIETWRLSLAQNFALRNPRLSARELNFAVQRTIDRLVFLRMCEDRGIEYYGGLQSLLNGDKVYKRLAVLFERADQRYNSGLFHFSDTEGDREPPDTLTLGLKLDDKVVKDIIKSLYYPESPYVFKAFPPEILGQVYEQFLGKVIRLTAGHHAKVEEKPEVRKAGGVYYTPAYIVDYIVNNTVGVQLEGRPPAEIGPDVAAAPRARVGGRRPVDRDVTSAARGRRRPAGAATVSAVRPFRILDAACGSGSFLLGAYQFLLNHHLAWYVAEGPEKHAGRLYQGAGGHWLLTIQEKKRILLNHIYGVDIDPQAVETTKLSLLLKVLEGESEQSIGSTLRLFHERALPDLDKNIKCGNSLIGPDFYDNHQLTMFDEEERLRINAFDWHREFREVFAPDLPPRAGRGQGRADKRARSASTPSSGGFDAVIGNPPYAYRNATEERLRPYYSRHYASTQGNFDTYKFFLERSIQLLRPGAKLGMIVSATFLVQPTFTKLRKLLLDAFHIQRLSPLGPKAFADATVDTAIVVAERGQAAKEARVLIQTPNTPAQLPHAPTYDVAQCRFATNQNHVFDYRVTESAAALIRRLLTEFPAIESGYEFGVGINTGYIRNELVADSKLDERYHRMLPGNGISRYGPVRTAGWIMYDRDFVRSRGKLGRTLPAEHLLSSEKIVVVRTRNLALPRRIIATIDRTRAYNLNRLSNIVARRGHQLCGLLAILNSNLFNWIFTTRFFDYEIKPIYLRNAPLADSNHKRMNALVESMLDLHKALGAAKTPAAQTAFRRQLDATDRQIDQLVYQLYALTDEEIRIVEDASAQ